MLLEIYDFGVEARTLHLIAGLILGLVFGIAAQISRFCLRRAVAGPQEERQSAAAVWLTALAAAVIGFTGATAFGLVDLSEHRFLSSELPIAALVLGGLAFGTGMVLTRGCVSRLTVLSGTGNLRAIFVLIAFAVTAHAALKGVLAPVRTTIGSLTVDAPIASLAANPVMLAALFALIAGFAALFAWRSGAHAMHLVLGAVIGLVAVGGWMATSVLLFDEFDPLPVQTAAFTLPWSDTLFWTIASTAIPAGFGVGFVGGVLAGGCTVGAGISGVATGSVAAIIALSSIAFGGWIAGGALQGKSASAAAA